MGPSRSRGCLNREQSRPAPEKLEEFYLWAHGLSPRSHVGKAIKGELSVTYSIWFGLAQTLSNGVDTPMAQTITMMAHTYTSMRERANTLTRMVKRRYRFETRSFFANTPLLRSLALAGFLMRVLYFMHRKFLSCLTIYGIRLG